MKASILGLGITGKAVAHYLIKKGYTVFAVDKEAKEDLGIPIVSENGPILLENIDLVVKSPGIPNSHRWVHKAREMKIPVIGEIDLAFEQLERKKKLVYGITGSNGKTTTTLMATHLFRAAGMTAVAAGNVGIPLISQVDEDFDIFVVELSSFQLENLIARPILDAALILNLTPNHLDRHSSFKEYKKAKFNIVGCLKKKAPLYISEQVLKINYPFPHDFQIFNSFKEKVETFLSLGYRDSSFRLFPHDLENLAAAYALARVPAEVLKQGIATFRRPPHRLEYIRTLSGVIYINDSKATSIDAVIKAVEACESTIILIVGGVDKGGDFRDWIPCFEKKVLKILAIGQASHRIRQELSDVYSVEILGTLEEAVCKASSIAVAGQTVLLSPGCSSYDQFKDFQHRGDVFKEIVEKLN
jgi:UDP-N-acetylmuramoylalanine--D-glutamate ligase